MKLIKRFVNILLAVLIVLSPLAGNNTAKASGWTFYKQDVGNHYNYSYAVDMAKEAQKHTFSGQWVNSVGFNIQRETDGSGLLYMGIEDASHTLVREEYYGAITDINPSTAFFLSVEFPAVYLDGDYFVYFRVAGINGAVRPFFSDTDPVPGSFWRYTLSGGWSEYVGGDMVYGFYYWVPETIPTVETLSATQTTGESLTFYGYMWDSGTSENVTLVGFDYGTESGNLTSSVSSDVPPEIGFTMGNFNLTTTENVTQGTIYYKAWAENESGRGYGLEKSFTSYGDPVVTTLGESESAITGVVAYTFSGNVVDAGNAYHNVSLRGFQIGLAPDSWDNNLVLQELSHGTNQTEYYDGSEGYYSLSSTLLSANTTYYFRAYAGYITSPDYSWHYGYGDTANFTTGTGGSSASVPKLTTDSVIYYDGGLTMGGTIAATTVGIIERGFDFGLSSDFVGSARKGSIGTWPTGYYVMTASEYYTPGQTIYVRAYAITSAGVTGYGNTRTYEIPAWPVGPGGLTIVNDTVVVNGNSVTLRANVTNPGGISLTRWGFEWEGKTTIEKDGSFSQASTGLITAIQHSVFDLVPMEVYYFRSGVLSASGNWYWSDWTLFTAEGTLAKFTGSAPIVTTLEASDIGPSGFTANGNLLNLGFNSGSYVSELGFVVSSDKSIPLADWDVFGSTGNFSTGLYSRNINVSQAGGSIFVAARAVNQYGTAFGTVYYVSLTDAAGSGGDSGATSTGSLGFLTGMMQSFGLDTPSGHWVFMALCMTIVGLLFGLVIVFSQERNFRIIFAIVMVLAELAIIGAFLFSGLLGIWPLIGLIFVAAGLFVAFGGRLVTTARAS